MAGVLDYFAVVTRACCVSNFENDQKGISSKMNTIEVEMSHGKIRGARNQGVTIFKGIPYAGRVSGDRRFRRPAELKPWSGVRDALQLGAPAMQASRPNEPEPAEDCLFLNIWTPATDNQKRPVMFYT